MYKLFWLSLLTFSVSFPATLGLFFEPGSSRLHAKLKIHVHHGFPLQQQILLTSPALCRLPAFDLFEKLFIINVFTTFITTEAFSIKSWGQAFKCDAHQTLWIIIECKIIECKFPIICQIFIIAGSLKFDFKFLSSKLIHKHYFPSTVYLLSIIAVFSLLRSYLFLCLISNYIDSVIFLEHWVIRFSIMPYL